MKTDRSMEFLIFMLIGIIFFIVSFHTARILKLEKALHEKCDTWNIAIGREQSDGSIEPQFVRICKDDYDTLVRLISNS